MNIMVTHTFLIPMFSSQLFIILLNVKYHILNTVFALLNAWILCSLEQ